MCAETNGVHRIVPAEQSPGAPAPGDGLSPQVLGSLRQNTKLHVERGWTSDFPLQTLYCHHGK